jgi:Ca-activated chloride channel family protein
MPHGFRLQGFSGRAVFWLVQAAAAISFSVQALALSPVPQPISSSKFAPPPDWRPPVIALNNASGQPIELRAASVEVDLFGDQAQTRVELRLFNPNPRVLEGELQFPLQEGQVVTGFALDVNGRLRDAAAVPKARGQEIFEDIRRRAWTRACWKRLPATSTSCASIPSRLRESAAWSSPSMRPCRASTIPAVLRVPLSFASVVGQLQVRVRAHGASRQDVQLIQGPAEAQLATPARQAPNCNCRKVSGWRPKALRDGCRLAVRRTDKPQIMLGESGGKPFFTAQMNFRDELVKRPTPSHIALVWDASASAAAQARVLPVLEAYFRKLDKTVKVSLLVVRNKAEPLRSFTVAPGRFGELADALRAEPFDGSSNFDNLPFPPTRTSR